MVTTATKNFSSAYRALRKDIFTFCRALKFSPTAQQHQVLSAVQRQVETGQPTHIAVKSGQGPGKTTVAAIIGLWKTLRFPKAETVVTAPTMRQCKDIWLKEASLRLQRGHHELRNIFDVEATKIKIFGDNNWGIKLVSATNEVNAQGWHNDHLSFIIDEASGVGRKIIETILGTTTNEDLMVLMIGNPNWRDSAFFDCFNRDRTLWDCHTLNAEESPIVNKKNIQRIADTYGKDSDVYRVRVLGEFPDQDPECVMSSDDVEYCMKKTSLVECASRSKVRQIGLDIARFGNDSSVSYRRSGDAIVEQIVVNKSEVDKTVGKVFLMQHNAGWSDDETFYVVDATGLGGGIMHLFYNAKKRVHEFNFGGSSTTSIYDDKVTEAFFQLAAKVKKREVSLPDDPALAHQLSTRQYALTKEGKIKVEDKDSWKARFQEGSPDKADACVMTFYDQHSVQSKVTTGR